MKGEATKTNAAVSPIAVEGEEGATLVVELPVPREVVEAASSILAAVASCWKEVSQATQIAEDAVVGVA